MAIIDKIQLSGTVYTIGNETTTAVTSASTDNEIPTAKAVYDAIPQGGGGKAVSAGTNISITTGETADTINCTLPIKKNAWNSLTFNSSKEPLKVLYASAFGDYTTASGEASFSIGKNTTASGNYSFVGGESNSKANGEASFAFGYEVYANASYSVAFGRYIITKNLYEFGCGILNNSLSDSSDSGRTLFSVGNGKNGTNHNALEIRQNGDIYIADTNDTSTTNYYEKPMIKLQDALGGGGSSYTAGDGIDITNDVISVTGKVDTSAFTAHTADTVIHVTSAEKAAWNDKQDALVSGTNIKTINNQSILGEGNITIEGGSGKAVSGGRGISITTGETADTVSFNLPISAGTKTNALIYNSTMNVASGDYSNAEGYNTTTIGSYSHAEGFIANAKGVASHAEGLSTKSKGFGSHAEGRETEASGDYSHSEGYLTRTTNESEHSSGRYNNSVSASTTFGDSGNTLFSVGNGTADNARHNAFEIRQNGDIYISKDGQDVKLQDQLGGGGSITIDQSLDSGSTNAVANSAITNAINDRPTKSKAVGGYQFRAVNDVKCINLTSVSGDYIGNNIYYPSINGKGIFTNNLAWAQNNYNFQLVDTSAITTSVTSSSTDSQVPSAKAVYDQLGGLKLVKLTQSEYDSLTTKDNSTLYVIVN